MEFIKHECVELKYRTKEWMEPNGEHCFQDWWECPVCGMKFTEDEIDSTRR